MKKHKECLIESHEEKYDKKYDEKLIENIMRNMILIERLIKSSAS